ncbi:uncharacterized protein LOC129243849 [Anastrepha obliqua]|uniref:uncharacterized protein LOC129243849 n=1 Tax=Anastrepha obliqua TaxID=95512 RepID=UPI002409D067|nr:uncharacterized protein LOC129243849 [Anastrepha obliqua]XP_054737207.1 uncharacterized protein LOC129243849 [Anastrepha obliqua]
MEWTREKTLALINEYRKRRGLWDMTHDDYRKKDVKQSLLIEVSESLGGNIPVGEIEKKFHTLRTQYHREINRMKRKEPYNSKWFGFKNLQFLSSPMARRLSRGRIKNEITEDGTVTTKYIIRDSTGQQPESNGSSAHSNNNINEEFLTIHQKPPTITIETIANTSRRNTSHRNTSRSRALEKLIEETTKDVEDIDDKPKMSVSLGHQGYSSEIHTEEELHNQRNHSENQTMEEEDEAMETLHLQGEEEEEITYPPSTGPEGCESGSHNQQTLHHAPIPTRIIKIQRRDTCNEAEFYEDESEQPHENKRIFYESTGQQHCPSLVTSTPSAASNSTNALLNPQVKTRQHKRQIQLPGRNLDENINGKSVTQVLHTSGALRDEFTTYGEYVSNEMRNITNREVLLGLKHKINTALFEAQMAELQK